MMNGHARKPRTPLHERLYRDLRQRIDSDEWAPGHQLPTELSLAEEFQVSRGTIRQAISRLADDGLVERTAGRGTFVALGRLMYPVDDLMGFTEQISASGHVPSSRLVEVATLTTSDLDRDHDFGPGVDRVLSLERVRHADGEPVALEHLLLPLPRFAGLAEVDLESASVYETLEDLFGVRIRLGDFTLDIENISGGQARLLDERSPTAVFLMSGNVYDQLGRTVVGVRCYYRPRKYSFQFSMSRKSGAQHAPPRPVLTKPEVH